MYQYMKHDKNVLEKNPMRQFALCVYKQVNSYQFMPNVWLIIYLYLWNMIFPDT